MLEINKKGEYWHIDIQVLLSKVVQDFISNIF